ncbi:ribonuclease P protein component [Algoriphagus vanfongensis]|uniref:ribonuclease P protein component n=1 Tax=Algoriphagus vanfongensis TaxID=426371 RepID=UPI00047B8085|nr:ribonuclease P protein component [Algoriphagus vanfongensis]
MNYRLPKSERLYAQKAIKELFNEGSSFFLYPFKVMYLSKDGEDASSPQVLFSVSKKKVKRAVGRNRLKRRIREAYRLNKHLLQNPDRSLYLGLIYVSSDDLSFAEIEKKVKIILEKTSTLITRTTESHE